MPSLAARALGVVTAASLGLTTLTGPAVAGTGNRLDLAVGGAGAYGTYDVGRAAPQEPFPPITVKGTLVVNKRHKCAVVQVAHNGPADELRWRTFGQLCGRGKTNFRTVAGHMFGGGRPQVRLCAGTTAARAQSGRHCDVHTPPARR